MDSSVPLTHMIRELGLICQVKKRKIHFRIHLDLRIQSWSFFFKKRTLMAIAFSALYPANLIKIAGGTIQPLSLVASRLYSKSLFGFKVYFVILLDLILIVYSL